MCIRDRRGVVGLDMDVWIDVANAITRRVELGAADVAGTVNYLTVEIAGIDDVEVDEAERSDSRGSEVKSRG